MPQPFLFEDSSWKEKRIHPKDISPKANVTEEIEFEHTNNNNTAQHVTHYASF